MTEADIIEQLRNIAAEKGISQFKIGKNKGISRATVKRFFDSEVSISLKNLLLICDELGMEIRLKKKTNR